MKQDEDIEDGAGGGIPIGRIIFALKKRMYAIFLFAALTTAFVGFLTFQLPNLYQATALVQVEARERTIANLKDVVSDLKVNGATMESEVEILRSRAIALKVIERLNLRNDPELFQGTGFTSLLPRFDISYFFPPAPRPPETSWAANAKSEADRSALGIDNDQPRRDYVAAAFANRLSVQRVRTTLLIAVSFRATDAQKAAKIANTVAEVYLEKQLEDKKRLTGYATETLDKKLDEMRTAVMNAERRVEEFKAANGIFATEGQILSEKELARLMEQTVIARNETSRARSKYEQALRVTKQGSDAGTLADVLDSNTIRLMRVQLAETTRKRAELETKYGPRHPEILKIQAKVRDARQDLQDEVKRLVAGLKNVYTEARNREAELQENLTELQTIEVTTKSQTVKLRELEREALSSKQLFEALLQRYKITAETQDLQLPDARIVETADIPLLPSSPNRKKLVALSAIGAFGIGIMLVLALEFATTGIGRPEDVETVLDVPYLSSLPLLEPSTNRNALHKIRMTIAEPDHDFVEAIRQARRDLDVRARNASGRVQLICSALPGEGSSIVASNLAHHYALTGQRVLLIDGDIRRAHLTRQLGPNHNVGLINVLQDGAPPEAAILQDTQTNLCFMPAITSSPSPHFNPELLAAPSFTGAIHKLRGYFDVIIMDTPPILPVIDTQFMADQADQLVLVLTWRKTPKALAKKAIKALGENRAKIAGVMVNRVDPDIIEDDRGIPHKLEYSA